MRTRTATCEPDLHVIVCAAFVLTAFFSVASTLVHSPLTPAQPPFEVPELWAVHFTVRSSSGGAVDVRIDMRDPLRRLVVEERPRNSGGGLGAVTRRVERGLSFDEWSAVRRGFELVGFWQLPARAESGMDGTTWIIVGTSPARAHRVVRWCAQELWPLGDLLLRLADLDPECEQVLLCSSLNSPA